VSQGLYSERFVRSLPAEWVGWACPAGSRAVIRSIVATNTAAAVARIFVIAAGANIYAEDLPATVNTRALDMRQVIYAGETIECYASLVGASVAVAGYLFTDTMGRQSPRGELITGSVARPLPARAT